MPADDPGTSHASEGAVWHHDLDLALRGKQPLGWSTWAAPIHSSQCLTAEGLRVAEWAVGILRGFLGDDFLQRVLDARVEHMLLSPSVSMSLWPIIDGRRVYVDLFRLAAQLALLEDRCLPLQTAMRNVSNPSDWTHALNQLEIAGLGLRDGWLSAFEVGHGAGYPVDVCLDKTSDRLQLEITSMGMAKSQREAEQFFHRVLMSIMDIELRYGVHVSGSVGDPVPENVITQWLEEIETAADATAHDRGHRWVTGGTEGKVQVRIEELGLNETHLEGATGITDTWGRLDLRVKVKARQSANAGRIWIWLEDHAGMWLFTPLAHMSLAERLGILAPRLREVMEPYPHLAGIILTPGRMWATGTMQDEVCKLPGFEGTVALRCLLPVAHVRDIIIVTRSGAPDDSWMALKDWYGREASWPDWALEQLGKPPLDALVHEPLGITEQH